MSLLRRLVFLSILVVLAVAPQVLAQGLPLTMAKSFTPSSVPVGGTATTTMTVTITNPNSFTVTGMSASDTYPGGLVPDVVGVNTCIPGSAIFTATGWGISNVPLGPGASCSVSMFMHASIPGQIVNTTSQVTATGVPPGGPASAVLNAIGENAPTLSGWMLIVFALTVAAVAALRIRG